MPDPFGDVLGVERHDDAVGHRDPLLQHVDVLGRAPAVQGGVAAEVDAVDGHEVAHAAAEHEVVGDRVLRGRLGHRAVAAQRGPVLGEVEVEVGIGGVEVVALHAHREAVVHAVQVGGLAGAAGAEHGQGELGNGHGAGSSR